MAIALVTGVTGQLGHYVAESLKRRGDQVWGLVRQSTLGRGVSSAVLPYQPITGDLLDEYSLASILEEVRRLLDELRSAWEAIAAERVASPVVGLPAAAATTTTVPVLAPSPLAAVAVRAYG